MPTELEEVSLPPIHVSHNADCPSPSLWSSSTMATPRSARSVRPSCPSMRPTSLTCASRSRREPSRILYSTAIALQAQPVGTHKRPETAGEGLHGASPTRLWWNGLLTASPQPVAKNALTMLINLTDDEENRENLAKDDAFLESLLLRITVCQFTGSASQSRREHTLTHHPLTAP